MDGDPRLRFLGWAGAGSPADGAARVVRRCSGYPLERPMPSYRTDANRLALVDDADGPRPAEVPARTRDDPVPAGGSEQPAAELLRGSRFRHGGGASDVRREYAGPVGRWRWAPLTDARRWAVGASRTAVEERSAIGVAAADRIVRRHATGMADANTILYSLTTLSAVGGLSLSAKSMRLRG